MAVQNNTLGIVQTDNYIRLQDLLRICLGKWYWFAISLGICLTVAVVYLLTTPPVYTRSASLLIKEESKGNSMNDVAGVLGSLNIFQTNTNVNNEIQSLQSPVVMLDVVKRLNLNINYLTDGRFRKQVLYGESIPYKIEFLDLADNDNLSLVMEKVDDNGVLLSDYVLNGEDVDGENTVYFNDIVDTPVGRISVRAVENQDSVEYKRIYVSRTGLQATVADYASNLTVSLSDEKSTVINLVFKDVCIQRAEEVLNTIIAVYNENWIRDKNQIAVSTSLFINERLSVIERELGNVDENISSYKSENLLPDVQAAASMYMAQTSETHSRIMAVNTQLSMARYIKSYLGNVTSQNQLLPANSGIESPSIEKQITDYNTMLLRRNNLAANSSESNPLVIDMDHSLQNMRNAIMSSIDNLITTLDTQLQSLQISEQQTTARIAANPAQGQYLLSVERQQKVKESLYLFLLQKREENELSQAFTAYNTRVITPPTGSPFPSSPVKRNVLLVAFVIGMLIPLVIIFLRENMNTKLRGRKDLENLSVPFLGEIPLHGSNGKKGSHEVSEIVIQHGKRDVINEAFRVLRTNIEFMLDTNNKDTATVCLFTSFNPGSGKTFLTINTAACLSLRGKRVLVIDGDLRRASISATFANSPKSGLSDYLGGRVDGIDDLIVDPENYPGISLLPVGTVPPNPTELLAKSRFKEMLDKVRDRYDYIFIDCPPVDIVADTQIIEKFADCTLFVVRVGLLERDMLPELQQAYDEKRYKNLAVILNGTDSDGKRYGYKYGYHYGYGNNGYYGSK